MPEHDSPSLEGVVGLKEANESPSVLDDRIPEVSTVALEASRSEAAELDDEFAADLGRSDDGIVRGGITQDPERNYKLVNDLIQLEHLEQAEEILLGFKDKNTLTAEAIERLGSDLADKYLAKEDTESLARMKAQGLLNVEKFVETALSAGQIDKVKVLLRDPAILGEIHETIADLVAELESGGADPKPEPKSDPKPDPKPEPKSDPKPEPKSDPKPDPKPDSTPDAEIDPKPESEPKQDPEAILKRLGQAFETRIVKTLQDPGLSLEAKLQLVRSDRDRAVAQAGLDRGDLDRLIVQTIRDGFSATPIDSVQAAAERMTQVSKYGDHLGLSSSVKSDLHSSVVEQVRENADKLFSGERESIREFVDSGSFSSMDNLQTRLQAEIRGKANTGNAALDRLIKVELGKEAVRAMLIGDPFIEDVGQFEMRVRADQAEDLARYFSIRDEVAETVNQVAQERFAEVPEEVKKRGAEAELQWIRRARVDLERLRDNFDLESSDKSSRNSAVDVLIDQMSKLDGALVQDLDGAEQRFKDERQAERDRRQSEAREAILGRVDEIVADADQTLVEKGRDLAELRAALIAQGGMDRSEADGEIVSRLEPFMTGIEVDSLSRADSMLWATNNMIRELGLSSADAATLRSPLLEAATEQVDALDVRTMRERQSHLETVRRLAARGGLTAEQREALEQIVKTKAEPVVESALSTFRVRIDRIMQGGLTLGQQKEQARAVIQSAIEEIRDPEISQLYRQELGLHALRGMLGDPARIQKVSDMENLMDYAEDLWCRLPIKDEASEVIADYAEKLLNGRSYSELSNRELSFLKAAIYEIQQENDLQSGDRSSSSDRRDAAINRLEKIRIGLDREQDDRRRNGRRRS